MTKGLKKYSLKKRNKICFLTVDNFETRQNIIDFLDTFELVDPKGIKQKLTVNDCLLQNKIKGNEDQIENTIEDCEHFIKFKEYFEKDKLVDFKNEEKNFCEKLFDDVPNIEKLDKDEKKNINNFENNGNSNSNFDINNNNNQISNQPTPIKGKFIIKKPQNINNNNNDNNNYNNSKANNFNYSNSNSCEDNNKKNNYYYNSKSNNYYDNSDNHNNDDYYSNGNRYNKNNNYYKKNNNYYNNNDGYYDNSSYKNGYKKGYRKGYK